MKTLEHVTAAELRDALETAAVANNEAIYVRSMSGVEVPIVAVEEVNDLSRKSGDKARERYRIVLTVDLEEPRGMARARALREFVAHAINADDVLEATKNVQDTPSYEDKLERRNEILFAFVSQLRDMVDHFPNEEA